MSMSYELAARRRALRELLEEARARLTPQDVGLPRLNGLRRVPGLRQSEVAELVDVSTRWYVTFEDGHSDRRFSVEFVQRVADALRLSEVDRVKLFRLTMPEVRLAVEHVERSALDGALRNLAQVRDLARRLTYASSFEDASAAAAETLERVLTPSCFAVATLTSGQGFGRVLAFGPKADLVKPAFAGQCIAVNYPNRRRATTFNESRPAREETADGSFVFEQQTTDGRSFRVAVRPTLSRTPNPVNVGTHGDADDDELYDERLNADDYWDWNSKVESRSMLTHGLFANRLYRGNLAALWTEPHAMAPIEIETLEAISALVELAGERVPATN